ncbi:uncharacterized protein UHOD_11906 [Ustilago sp. UG-2017b]|nr:uncharacterized protein UHOD_11906 [Ustilago sp. UG-2017b]
MHPTWVCAEDPRHALDAQCARNAKSVRRSSSDRSRRPHRKKEAIKASRPRHLQKTEGTVVEGSLPPLMASRDLQEEVSRGGSRQPDEVGECHDSVMTLLIFIIDLTWICHFTAKESQTRRIESCTFDLIVCSFLPLFSFPLRKRDHKSLSQSTLSSTPSEVW